MKKRILMLATGGTIASRESSQGLAPAITSEELLGYVPGIGGLCRVETVQLMNLDSTNVGPSHWLSIARAIEAQYWDYDGFVVTHGTDTMAYTAAALSYLIQRSPKPIVLTGSQRSICMEDTDARMNLYNAFLYAAAEGSRGEKLQQLGQQDGRLLLLSGIKGFKTVHRLQEEKGGEQPVLCVLAGQQDLRRDAQALCDLLHSTQSGIALTVQDVPQGGVPDPKLTGEFHQRSAPGLIDQAEVPGKVLVERVCGFQRHCGIISLSGEFGRNAENRMTDPPFRAS